jgi:hypothetical protein
MVKISKRNFFLITAFAILLLFATFSLIPITRASTISNVQDQTNTILTGVLGINPNAYSIRINSQTSTQDNGRPQNGVDFTLFSNQSSMRVKSSFVNSSLASLYLSEYSGTLATVKPTSCTGNMAKTFLENYEAYTKDSFYGTLASTLNDITGSANVTQITRNVTLKVNSEGSIVDFIWTYTDANGITAQAKNVVLSYCQGQLNCFANNWPLYNIVGTPTISRQQAIDAALNATKNYTYQINNGNATDTVEVAGFQVASESLNGATLSYGNFPNTTLARDSDPFNLYPSWWVPVGFNKFYPGDVSGIAVTVWADTGKVSSTELMYADSGLANATKATATQSVGNNIAYDVSESSLSLSAPLAIVALLFLGALFANKKRLSKSSAGKKIFNPMLWGFLLCGLIVLSASTSVVKADSVIPSSSSQIYGSLDGGNGSPAQSPAEQTAAFWVQTQLNSSFTSSGYSVSNNVRYNTTRVTVEGNAYWDALNRDHCTVFHYGHMAGFGTGYVDNGGDPINASELGPFITNKKYDLVVLWVCCQCQTSVGSVCITPICNAWMNDGVNQRL